MHSSRLISAELRLDWQGPRGHHRDRWRLPKLNLWRDYLPGDMAERLAQLPVGGEVSAHFDPGELVAPWDSRAIHKVPRARFPVELRGIALHPLPGRFFPRTLLPGVGDTFQGDLRALRVVAVEEGAITVDFNHPLCRYPLTLTARVAELLAQEPERGGRCNDIPQVVTERGPGMQGALPEGEGGFLFEGALERMDPRDDSLFYAQPRLVHHLDAAARTELTALYRRLLPLDGRLLDLMASWESHLPTGASVIGLGLNADELAANPALSERVVQDLNVATALPWPDGWFAGVVCSASVEYLVAPQQVLAELHRVLRPGAPLVITFSDRFFPTKAIRLWSELHPFERMGLVLEWLAQAGFSELASESVRNLPRPADDPYASQLPTADPLFAVWGRKPG